MNDTTKRYSSNPNSYQK